MTEINSKRIARLHDDLPDGAPLDVWLVCVKEENTILVAFTRTDAEQILGSGPGFIVGPYNPIALPPVRDWGSECAKCSTMHRRAQEAEKAAVKAQRQNDHERLWKTVASLKRQQEHTYRKIRFWRDRYRELEAERKPVIEKLKNLVSRWRGLAK